MGQLSATLRQTAGGVGYWCPGCRELHVLPVPRWTWNGDVDRPTFAPSVLIRSGHYVPGHDGDCWCTYNAAHPGAPAPFGCGVCHHFVRDGQLEFLADSTHALAGQTVPLPDLPPHLRDSVIIGPS